MCILPMLLPWAANAKSYSLLGFPQRSRKAFLDSHTNKEMWKQLFSAFGAHGLGKMGAW
jgi:hypothetical protein